MDASNGLSCIPFFFLLGSKHSVINKALTYKFYSLASTSNFLFKFSKIALSHGLIKGEENGQEQNRPIVIPANTEAGYLDLGFNDINLKKKNAILTKKMDAISGLVRLNIHLTMTRLIKQ